MVSNIQQINISHQEMDRLLKALEELYTETKANTPGMEWMPVHAVGNLLCHELGCAQSRLVRSRGPRIRLHLCFASSCTPAHIRLCGAHRLSRYSSGDSQPDAVLKEEARPSDYACPRIRD
jgi:hypothetical protein